MTENKNVFEDKEQEQFEKDNEEILSESNALRDAEIRFRQPIKVNPDQENQDDIIRYLKASEKIHQFKLASPHASQLIASHNESAFERALNRLFGDDKYQKAVARVYHYLVIMNRRMVTYHIKGKDRDFDLRDVYELGGIQPQMFNSINEVPSGIVDRMKLSSNVYTSKARNFEHIFKQLERQLNAQHNKISQIAGDEGLSSTKKESKAKALEIEILKVQEKMNQLGFDIRDELLKYSLNQQPSKEEIYEFIRDFIKVGILNKVSKDSTQSNLTIHDLHFIDNTHYIWQPAYEELHNCMMRLSPSLKLPHYEMKECYKNFVDTVREGHVNHFTYKKDCLFLNNGVIPITFNDDGSTSYRFIHNDDLTIDEKMFDYATNHRMNVDYTDDIPTVFDDNPFKEPVTPDYIYGALGRRGYEDNEKEATARANLLMKYSLKSWLIFNNDLPHIKDTFLYFYNAGNSGKSTYMNLMMQITGESDTATPASKDLSSKESFGLGLIKNKKLILIDEATDGKSRMDVENIKKISAKEPLTANVKNKEHVDFTPEGSMIFASNEEPMFNDESEGLRRRLLAFQLENGYNDRSDDTKDLEFIKNDLIKRNSFKLACILWTLDHVDMNQERPQSVISDATDLVNKEDDVQSFIKDRVRQTIDEPLFISIDHLYELYRLESLSRGRKASNIRNKSKFKRELLKMRSGLYLIKGLDHSQVDTINRVIYLQGMLFEDYFNELNNNELNNTIIKVFMDFSEERKKRLNQFYDQVIQVINKEIYLSEVSRKRGNMIGVMPDNEMYNIVLSDKDLKDLAKTQKKQFLESTLKLDKTIESIKSNKFSHLPFVINPSTSNKFTQYSYKNDNKNAFSNFMRK